MNPRRLRIGEWVTGIAGVALLGIMFLDWYGAGELTVPGAGGASFQVDSGGAELLREFLANTGALVCGRRLFDINIGWY